MTSLAKAALQGALAGVLLILATVTLSIGVETGHPWIIDSAKWTQAQLGTFVSTAAGVFLAFWLEERRRRRASRERFGHFLLACRYDLVQLHVQCGGVLLRPGYIVRWPLDAPVLRALAASPDLHEHGADALATVLPILVSLLDTTRNALNSSPTTAEAQVDLRPHIEQLQAGTLSARTIVDQQIPYFTSRPVRTTAARPSQGVPRPLPLAYWTREVAAAYAPGGHCGSWDIALLSSASGVSLSLTAFVRSISHAARQRRWRWNRSTPGVTPSCANCSSYSTWSGLMRSFAHRAGHVDPLAQVEKTLADRQQVLTAVEATLEDFKSQFEKAKSVTVR